MLLCKEEFKMKIPNYTIDTLDFLRNKYPDFIFKLLIGEDNFLKIKLWKNYSKILNNYEIIIYPRNNLHTDIKSDRTIKLDHKLIDISSSKIRNNIKLGLSISEYVPSKINKLIKQFKMMSDMMKKMSKGKKIPSGGLPDEIMNQLK